MKPLLPLLVLLAITGCRDETISNPPRPEDPLALPPGFEYRCSVDGLRYASALKGASNFLTVAQDSSKLGAANAAWHAYWNGWKSISAGFSSDGSTNKPFYYSCE